jgi:hypothetical protein
MIEPDGMGVPNSSSLPEFPNDVNWKGIVTGSPLALLDVRTPRAAANVRRPANRRGPHDLITAEIEQ